MEWLYYLLEANLYLLLFYGFYRIALATTTFYNGNRYYLISSIILSFLIPLVQLSYLKPTVMYVANSTNVNLESLSSSIGIESIVQALYLIICGLFSVKLILSLSKIVSLWKNGKKHKSDSYTIVELSEKPSAFSFFNLLFIHPSLINNNTIIRHELIHIKEKHSFDLLLLECINVISWFNPVNYLIKKDLKLLHEFIADQATTNEQNNKHQYAMFLIESSLYNFSIPFTNQFFNQQILKQRINMLNKEKSAKWVRLNFALAIPLVLGMLCLSTLAFSKDYGYFDILSKDKSLQDTTKKMKKRLPPPSPTKPARRPPPPPVPPTDQVKFPPPIVKPDGKNLKTAPPVEPPPPGYKTKRDQVKFPPPIVKPDGKNIKTAPPIAPPPPPRQDKIKFPPPIVKPIQKSKKRPPAVEPPPPRQDKVKFPPPILRQDKSKTKDQSSAKLKIQEQVKINQRFLIERLEDQANNKNAQKLMIEKQKVEAINEMNRQINLAKEKREEEKLRKKLDG